MKLLLSALSPFRTLIRPRTLLLSLVLAFTYLSILIYAPNYRLLGTLIHNDYSLQAKLTIIGTLFLGGLQTQSLLGLFLLLLTALLIGLNASLMMNSYQTFKQNGKAHLAVGGSMVLGFVSTSCAVMCGFSLLPLIGTTLGASFSILDGISFRIITVILLTISLFYTLSSSRDRRSWLVSHKK